MFLGSNTLMYCGQPFQVSFNEADTGSTVWQMFDNDVTTCWTESTIELFLDSTTNYYWTNELDNSVMTGLLRGPVLLMYSPVAFTPTIVSFRKTNLIRQLMIWWYIDMSLDQSSVWNDDTTLLTPDSNWVNLTLTQSWQSLNHYIAISIMEGTCWPSG